MTVRLPVAASELPSAALPADGKRKRIHPADVRGRFHRRRQMVFALLIAVWAALPWVRVGEHPAVFIDVDAHELYLFGLTFNPQDAWLLFFLLTGVGFALVYATALAGRVWCGWACPQTVFLEGVYRQIERWIEGARETRIRRDAGPLTVEKGLRKTASHAAFAAVSFLLANVVLAYFASLPKTLAMMRQSPAAHAEAFGWVVIVTAVLYLDFAWFREQLCVVLCPYGRLQSALLDEQSLVVGYDVRRGEPRGKKGSPGAGDCVNCKRCIAVCPTGIDIRNGVQMECLACTACIDACDEVMGLLKRPSGLIRYDSIDGLAGKARRILRPRLVLYSVLLVVGLVVALLAAGRRTEFEAALLRLPGEPYALDAGEVRNAFQVHIVNKRGEHVQYRVEVDAANGMTAVIPMPSVEVDALGDVRVPLFLDVPRDAFHTEFPVTVRIASSHASDQTTVVTGTFLGPAR